MTGAGKSVAHGLRRSIVILAVVAAVVVTSTDADARSRKRRSIGSGGGYTPPYASIVVDANTGRVLQETNPDSLRHPASLTKIMTLYLLFERLEAGKIKLGTQLPVSAHAAAQAPTKLGLKPGSTISAEDAIRGLVTRSANDAAAVIAEAIADDEDSFAELMTRKARAIGMSRTVYRNASGLPNSEQVTTARDQAILGRAIQERFPRYYTYFSTPSFAFRGTVIRNHNRLLGRVEGVDGIKTGYTNASGFNLVTSMKRNGRHIVAVILGGRSAAARDARMRDLVTDKIAEASAVRSAPMIAEAVERTAPAAPKVAAAPKTAPTRIALASAGSTPVNLAPQPAAPTAVTTTGSTNSAHGSTEPLQPVKVKTIKVKLSGLQTASMGPPIATLPIEETPAPAAPPAAAKAPAAPEPAPVVNPRPGVLGVLTVPAAEPAAVPAPAPVVAAVRTAAAPPSPPAAVPSRAIPKGGWVVQIGAFPDPSEAKDHLQTAQSKAKSLLAKADGFTEPVVKGAKTLYRARFAGLDKDQAEAVCKQLKRNEMACLTIKN
jgi:D-alanyl-D-alanine carboxypeptidase